MASQWHFADSSYPSARRSQNVAHRGRSVINGLPEEQAPRRQVPFRAVHSVRGSRPYLFLAAGLR